MRKAIISLFSTLLLIPSLAFSMAQWDRVNAPELMHKSYERNFSKLPKSGKLTTLPWSDDYWPTYKGGITYRWNKKIRGEDESPRWTYKVIEDIEKLTLSTDELSPAEKYDLYLGNSEFPLTKFERQRTKIMKTVPTDADYDKDFKIPEWEGLCHAWAPATLHFKNSEAITVVGKKGHKITFATSDLHALLTYHLHLNKSPKTSFMGSRCNLVFADLEKKLEKKEITEKEYLERINSAECKDTNAGAFHVALVNQIGLMDQGFVVDVTRDSEVWNQPVYSFDVKVLGTKNGATEGAAPGTVKEITVLTRMGFVSEIEQHFSPVTKPFYIKIEEYKYRVELNAAGEIIGGEWLSFDRPDFIWKSAPVPFKGYFKDLEKLYFKSVAYLNPSKFTFELKEKMKKAGRLSLIEREFIKDARMSSLRTKLRNGTIDQMIKNIAVKGFKEAGAKEKAERIAENMATFKKEAKTNVLAAKFINGAKEEVRSTHIETAVNSAKEELHTNFLASKFITGAKEEVRNSHIETAINSANTKLGKNYLASKFIAGAKEEVRNSHIEAAVLNSKKKLHPTYLAKTFVTEVSKDAKETRRIKEEHKNAAKAEVMLVAAGNFYAKKFATEVSKDAKESRVKKEANKAKAKAALNKFSNSNFYGKKFITEVKTLAIATRKVKEEQRLAAQKKLDQELMGAVIAGDMAKFKDLLAKGANPSFSNETGTTPLMIAVQKEDRKIVSALLKVLDEKAINAVDNQGRNALIWAIVAPNQKPDRDTRSLVRELLDRNINVNQKDNTGMTALAYVTSGQYKSKLITWALKERGAKL